MWHWQLGAACRDFSELFTAEGETGPNVDTAKKICAGCPVKASCLDWSTTHREPAGVWAGLTADEREQYIRKNKIPHVATLDISAFVDAIALGDKIDAHLADRNREWPRLGAPYGLGREGTVKWKTRFDERISGRSDEAAQPIMRAG